MATVLRPQKGAQERFLASPGDIVIYGGAAGAGKTYALLLAALRYKNVPGYSCTIFRKNYNQIFAQGGLYDTSFEMYSGIKGALYKASKGEWSFSDANGKLVSKINFKHIERDEELQSYQGAQICGLLYDELTHFTSQQFFYMLSRNRSTCGVKPFVRATCNPDADSWVAEFIEWWIDQDTGYPIPERSGKLRYFIRRDETLYWANTKQELWEQFNLVTPEERAEPRSATFVCATLQDNEILMKTNPSYLANLKALPIIERERLLYGNWKIKQAAGMFFKKEQVGNYIRLIPDDVLVWVRCWDLAATEKTSAGDPAYTAGVLMGKRKNGRYVVADVINRQMAASDVRKTIKMTAELDRLRFGNKVMIRIPQDPGQAGKEQAQTYIKELSGYAIRAVPESGSKESRAEPMAAQWQAGNFDILIAPWNEMYLTQLENFPEGKFKDMVDASANGFAEIETRSRFSLANML